jgi:hypothetical protein
VIPSPPAGARRAYGPDLRLSLIQARGAPARIDVPLGIDVDRDGPEPTQLGLAMPIFIDARIGSHPTHSARGAYLHNLVLLRR